MREEISRGDSGAWVVHAASQALYVHVVAMNTFGQVYVVPANDTFGNIRECLGASSISIPSATEASDVDLHGNPKDRPCSSGRKTVANHSKRAKSLSQGHPGRSDESVAITRVHKLLHGVKIWPLIFSTSDRLSYDDMSRRDSNDHDFDTKILHDLLGKPGSLAYSYDVIRITRFSDEQGPSMSEHSARAWLYDASAECSTPNYLTATELDMYLRKHWHASKCHQRIM